MTGLRHARVLLTTLLALAAGCAAFVSKDEYRDYRAVRVAQSDRDRLVALGQYAQQHRDGHWIDEVESERSARELSVFESGKSSRAGLELYLQVYPQGTFASQASSRLTAIAAIEARKQADAEQAERLAAERAQREAELQRTWVTRFAAYWLRTLATLDGWGAPIAELAQKNPSFSRAFGRPPRPRCTRETCVKVYSSPYAVPVPSGTRIERTMQLALRLEMSDGRVIAAELLAPRSGFSRWREVEEQKPMVDSDAEHRAGAVSWAFERLRAALLQTRPDAERLASVSLPELASLTIAASGEATDTTAEDPSAPANRLADGSMAAADEASGPQADAIDELVKPEVPQEVDMDFAPVRIDAQGRAHAESPPAGAPSAAPPARTDEGEEMVLAPLVVPPSGPSAPTTAERTPAADSEPPPQPSASLAMPVVQAEAYRVGDVRIVFFADAPVRGGGTYDGVRIERISRP